MSHMIESRHIWMSGVTHDWVVWYINRSCHAYNSSPNSLRSPLSGSILDTSCVTWVMSHMTESRHTYNSLTKVAMVTSLFLSIRYFTCISATWVMSDQNVSYHTYNNLARLVFVRFICVLGTSYMWHEACHNRTSHVTRTTISRNSFPSRSSVY